ncbi:hypothetical protein [uncultured Duncaniella sp.]|uniref:hypothetical protein n=1 Tax=uncultured Duncaniella sp. TaxID=2768039 RepID=UPI0025A94AB0|nr:hypothetical protein [uncultured Duncaniella sp.]
MNVIIESLIFDFDDKIRAVVLDLINRILLTRNETELRETVAVCAERTDLNKFFLYGYGKHHFWVKQRLVSDPAKTFDQRMIIVNF